jgi:nickel/cobalt transporter (NicO) family protein
MSAGDRVPGVRRWLVTTAASVLLLTSIAGTAFAQFGALGRMHPAPAIGFFGWLLAQQAFFYQALAGLIRQAKSNGSANWAVMAISFVYGIFHAAGPGHGKAVISSYLLANEETWRRGVMLSFASAALQSLTAVAIVGVAAVLIGGTAQLMGNTVRTIETASYVLIIVIGARMLWVKGKSFHTTLQKLRNGSDSAAAAIKSDTQCHHHEHSHDEDLHHGDYRAAHAAHDHVHDEHGRGEHDHGDPAAHAHHHAHDDEEGSILPWGHAHGPEPEELAGPGGWRRGLSAIVAVGMRPCSVAIIVLVFALAQGLFWAGIASTFVMGLGTAITVGSIASLAVGAKSLAKRLATTRTGYGALVLRGFEVGAACLVMLVGVGLLTGCMASERMGFF